MSDSTATWFTGVAAIFSILIILFTSMLMWNIFTEDALPEIINATNNVNVPADIRNNLDNIESTVDSFTIPFDLIFIAILTSIVISTIVVAISAEPISNLKFLLMLFVGGIILGLVLYFVTDILQYFLNSYLLGLFNYDLSMTTVVVDNIGLFLFIWYVVTLMSNQAQKWVTIGGFAQ